MDLTTYIEDNQEASNDKYISVKNRIKTILAAREPDMDVSDDSVVGDLIINRFSKVVALAEEGQACMFSDIQLSNILNGSICDCAFAESFVKSLGLDTLLQSNTLGVLRMRFNTNVGAALNVDSQLIIPSGTSIAFDNQYIFNIYTPKNGDIIIQFPMGLDYTNASPYTAISNGNVFYAGIDVVDGTLSPSSYFVDLPIYGPSAAEVSAGEEAETDLPETALDPTTGYITSIASIQDINPITTDTSLVQLAKLAQKIYPSANFSTKGGIVSYLTKQFPAVNCVSPVSQNDLVGRQNEIYIGSTATGISQAAIDIYTKSGPNLIQVTQYVPFTSGKDLTNFVALMGPAITLDSASYTYQASIGSSTTVTTTLSTSVSDTGAWLETMVLLGYGFSAPSLIGSQALNSKDSRWLNLNVMNADNTPVDLSTYAKGYIQLTYSYDPAIMFAGSLINSPICTPTMSTQVKSFVSCLVNSLNISYAKNAGASFDRQTAKTSIYELINEICYPLEFNNGYITDILLSNGAARVSSIAGSLKLQLCPYTSWLYVLSPDQSGGVDPIYFGGDLTTITNTTTLENLNGYFSNNLPEVLGSGETKSTQYSYFNSMNIGFWLKMGNINLSEGTI